MKHTFNVFFSVLLLTFCSCKNTAKEKSEKTITQEVKKDTVEQSGPAPIMLDDIHYYTLDRKACNAFFETNFKTKAMLEESPNPFEFIDFQLVRNGQSTINISGSGPFPGIRVGDPKRWERKLVKPSPDNPPKYGVHWISFGTKNLDQALGELKNNGVQIIDANFNLPYSDQRAILCYGPDYNLITVVENKDDSGDTPFYIDHLLLLVNNLDENLTFFTDVLQGEILMQKKSWAKMKVAEHTMILATPEAMNIDRASVVERDPKIFRPDIDHIGFLYKDIKPAYEHAIAKGYEFVSPPVKIKYYEKPTLYTFGITYSPDGLQCELFQEEGRTSSRKQFKKRVKQ